MEPSGPGPRGPLGQRWCISRLLALLRGASTSARQPDSWEAQRQDKTHRGLERKGHRHTHTECVGAFSQTPVALWMFVHSGVSGISLGDCGVRVFFFFLPLPLIVFHSERGRLWDLWKAGVNIKQQKAEWGKGCTSYSKLNMFLLLKLTFVELLSSTGPKTLLSCFRLPDVHVLSSAECTSWEWWHTTREIKPQNSRKF